MNIEQIKQFIKEVRWGFLATTDGRISCSTSVPVRVSVRVSPCFCLCQSVFLSVPVRVYEILRRYIEDESVDLVYLDPPFKSDQDYNILFAERNGAISPFNLHSEIRNLKYSPACGGKEN